MRLRLERSRFKTAPALMASRMAIVQEAEHV